jgi:hypothetical protein
MRPMPDLTPMNLTVSEATADQVAELAEENDWSKRTVVEVAVRNLAHLLETLPKALENYPHEIVQLFREVVREMPSRFVELSPDLKFAHLRDGRPAIVLPSGWVVYPDESGELMALHEATDRRAKVVDGELKVLKLPTPEEIVLN